METNNNNCRRSFLRKCVALTAGATVLGSGIKLMANPEDEWRWIAYCGAKCDNTCSWFSNNQCPSCKSISYNCSVQKCARAKQIPTCAHCNELDTCDDKFWTDNPKRYTDIKALRDSLNPTDIKNNTGGKQEILIFPNPARDYLKLQINGNQIFNYEIVNINGQILKKGKIESKELTINISDIKPGTYLFRLIRNNNVLQTQQVIKL
jgi:hypothetical protein